MPFLVLRVPNIGPKALAGPPNDFPNRESAEARLKEIMSAQLMPHHTHIENAEYSGDKNDFLARAGILL
ncbi:MAG: hypothetical protein AAF899_15535 [Pseudomonadota bacterium]